ncbi:MAG: oligosaccharide flippase family protein [Planctomycetota bacterium]
MPQNASNGHSNEPYASADDVEVDSDPAGRDRMVSNVLFSWGGHFVFIIAGFVMPRMIDRRLGKELLGIWDFAWSLVAYFHLVEAGISSSVNRYVARYRAAGDLTGVNSIVSSATCMLGVAGLIALGLTATLSALLPRLFGQKLEPNVLDAQWVVLFLGTSVCVQVAFGAFNGVLTGCHRWGLHNLNMSGWHAATVVGMLIALPLGCGLRTLALIALSGQVLSGGTKVILAHCVCEGLRLRPSLVRRQTIRNVFFFGGKTLIPSVSNLLLIQTSSILIVASLGTPALALYARPRSLTHHIDTLVRKMAMVLIPTTSSLQSTGDIKAIQELLLKSVRYSFYMVLPMVLVLVIFGGPIMHLWMGPDYANGVIPAILAAGILAALVQRPVLMILAGMNAHGRAGMAQLVASVCSVGMTILALWVLKWGLVGVAIGVTLPLTIMNLTYLPFLVCRRVGLSISQYFLSAAVSPVIHVLPFAICLAGARFIFETRPLTGLVAGGIVAGTVLAIPYWRYVLPARIKTWLLRHGGAGVGAV